MKSLVATASKVYVPGTQLTFTIVRSYEMTLSKRSTESLDKTLPCFESVRTSSY